MQRSALIACQQGRVVRGWKSPETCHLIRLIFSWPDGVYAPLMKRELTFNIAPQPDDTTCGPTCLHAIYRYFGDTVSLKTVIQEVPALEEGGTLAVMLANHAIRRGYRATIYTYNINLFDPTWFQFSPAEICERLKAQLLAKHGSKLELATQAYIEFLELGGRLRMQDLTPSLIRKYLNKDIPILTGLSSTYLYQSPREFGPKMLDDDIRGIPAGHFTVLRGYDRTHRHVFIADPLESNPYSPDHQYTLSIDRVVSAILLGIITDDANLLIIQPASKKSRTKGI
jgi:hypothetical protein